MFQTCILYSNRRMDWMRLIPHNWHNLALYRKGTVNFRNSEGL